MPRSTARFISYDLRPTKQSERRILINLLKVAGDSGLPIPSYRYVGMGANRFYDFLLLHKYVGIDEMISIEHDPEMYKRAVFNVPYEFIKVLQGSVSEFISRDKGAVSTVYWFDYDGGISPSIVYDISSIATKLKLGEFCFVTVGGRQPRVMERDSKSGEERVNWLKDNIGEVAGDVTTDDTESSHFPHAVHKILMAAFRNAFAQRRDGTFVPLLQVTYSDSMPMVTVGGAFLAEGTAEAIHAGIARAMPFLETRSSKLYEISSLNITERERALFDRAATALKTRTKERNTLKKLGFADAELKAYKDFFGICRGTLKP